MMEKNIKNKQIKIKKNQNVMEQIYNFDIVKRIKNK